MLGVNPNPHFYFAAERSQYCGKNKNSSRPHKSASEGAVPSPATNMVEWIGVHRLGLLAQILKVRFFPLPPPTALEVVVGL